MGKRNFSSIEILKKKIPNSQEIHERCSIPSSHYVTANQSHTETLLESSMVDVYNLKQ